MRCTSCTVDPPDGSLNDPAAGRRLSDGCGTKVTMSLRSIAVRNYRCFEQRQELEISPVTVILGKNNAGKSAILRAPLLAEAGLNTNSPAAFDLEALRAPRVTHFSDLVFGREPFRPLGLELQTDSAKLEAEVRYDDASAHPIVQSLSLQAPSLDVTVAFDPTTERHEAIITGATCEVESFRGLRPMLHPRHEFQNMLLREDWPHIGQVYYIGPFRKQLKPVHHIPHNNPTDVGAFGQYVLDLLASDYVRGDQRIIRQVNVPRRAPARIRAARQPARCEAVADCRFWTVALRDRPCRSGQRRGAGTADPRAVRRKGSGCGQTRAGASPHRGAGVAPASGGSRRDGGPPASRGTQHRRPVHHREPQRDFSPAVAPAHRRAEGDAGRGRAVCGGTGDRRGDLAAGWSSNFFTSCKANNMSGSRRRQRPLPGRGHPRGEVSRSRGGDSHSA